MQTEILQIRQSEDKGADGISSLASLGLTVTTSLTDIPHISSNLTASFKHLLNDKAILIMFLQILPNKSSIVLPVVIKSYFSNPGFTSTFVIHNRHLRFS